MSSSTLVLFFADWYIGRCQELLAEIVHTKDGSRVVREFVARGTAKVNSLDISNDWTKP